MDVFEKTAVIGIFGVLLALGMASATVLNSFGTISGEAQVEPALSITGVNASGSEMEYVNFTKNAPGSISVGRLYVANEHKNFDSLSGSDVVSGENVIVTSEEISSSTISDRFGDSVLHLTTNSSTVGGALSDEGGTVHIRIDDTILDSYSYGDVQ